MDNLPEQRIEDLAGATRREAYDKIGCLCVLRRERTYSEEERAQKAGFGTAEAMHRQLEIWGLTGLLPLREDRPARKTKLQEEPMSSDRLARKSGPVEELPLAREAIPLFREALETLSRDNEDLRYRRESRQGKHYPYRIVSRGSSSDDERNSIVERLGLGEVDRGSMYFDGAEVEYGTNPRAPLSPLPELIGTYLLAGGDVEKLVKALHPEDSEPNWPEITRWIEGVETPGRKLDGIKSIALRLAILIRGGANTPGKPPPGESGHALNLSHRIAAGLRAGMPRKQLYGQILTKFGLSKEDLPWSEFNRLADLGLELPRSPEEP
jgi:hypothetical protein